MDGNKLCEAADAHDPFTNISEYLKNIPGPRWLDPLLAYTKLNTTCEKNNHYSICDNQII